ncbi:putative exocyst complex component sec8 [Rhodotorula toruloides]|nr:putative exocyst complex component sec8 [Rhodotorula toruloides]
MSRLPPGDGAQRAQQGSARPSSRGHTSSPSFGSELASPVRPERSQRRPAGSGMTPSPATLRGNENGRFPGQTMQAGGPDVPRVGVTSAGAGGNGEGKNRRMMDQLRGGNDAPGSPSFSPNPAASTSSNPFGSSLLSPIPDRSDTFNNFDDASSSSSSRAGSPEPGEGDSPSLVVPTALSEAISAFTTAGQRRADGRRGGLADQGFDVPSSRRGPGASGSSSPELAQKSPETARSGKVALNPHEYPDTPAFREVDDVLRKVRDEWPELVRGTSLAGQADGQEDEGDFDPVSLALHLLEPARRGSAAERDPPRSANGTRQTLPSFLRLKGQLDHAIRSTLSPQLNPTSSGNAYRAYESAITTHNATLGALTNAQKMIAGMRTGLGSTREKLEGTGREGLAGMYARMGMLEEMGGMLDEIDSLMRLPPSLEALLAEKRFLGAVVLLVRSIKALHKPEMLEIGALSDLRAWAVAQEGVVLEILIEELHNHLYLKSFYCDVRWKSYARGQTQLPLVDFGEDAEPTPSATASREPNTSFQAHSSGRSTARLPRLSKLQRFLQNLALKPSGADPALDEAFEDLLLDPADAADGDDGLGGSLSLGAGEGLDGFGASAAPSSTKARREAHKRRNPELDSFTYIEMLIESLAALGKLGYALDAVGQRVQGEMFALVEATVEEVEERNDSSKPFASTVGAARPASSLYNPPSPNPNASSSGTFTALGASASASAAAAAAGSWATEGVASLLRLSASETNTLASSVETLRDLFWTLYSKLDAVLQGFRVSYEVASRISERRDFKDASLVRTSSGNLLFSLLEVWKSVQQEVRALLHDYLTDDQSGTVSSRNPIVSVNEVLRFPRPRDGSKQVFRFAESDLQASHKLLKDYEDALNMAIKAAVPGLITDGAPSTTTTSALIVASTDPSAAAGRSTGLNNTHKALVPADAFNVSVLFGPTLAFLDRVKEVMPGGLMGEDETSASTGFNGFLDEFVLRTFLPQLEEKVASVFHQAVGGIDAFQEDPNSKRVSRVPIVRSVSNLMLLISALCSMLRATPFHRENYSQLIVSVIHQFYQRCFERFKDLAARETTDSNSSAPSGSTLGPLKMAATWADMPELHACLTELRGVTPGDVGQMRQVLAKETKIELDRKRNGFVKEDDLISPSKKLSALATLYSSLDWFIHRVSSLKSAEGTPAAFSNGFSGPLGSQRPRESAYSIASTDTGHSLGSREMEDEAGDDRPEGFALPLTSEMTKPFEALLRSYRQLADMVLFTLRLEIRLRTMHYLDKATRDGVYQLAEDIQEPDPSVVDLNSNLAECDEIAASTLSEGERKYIFEGLSLLMDQLLVHNARFIRLANHFGQAKMLRNILALQQNLKNLGDSPLDIDFDRSRRFWDLFTLGPKTMLDMVRKGEVSYDFDDLKALLNLQCGVDQSGKDGSAPNGASLGASGGPGDVPLSGGTDRNRRQYNEFLIELFSLDPTGGMADD